jgi:putative membrane protein
MKFLVNTLISAIAIAITAFLIPGIEVNGLWSAILVAVVMALLNRFVKPVLALLTLPLSVLTLGLSYLAINVMLVFLAEWIIQPGFEVSGILPALFFSVVLSVVNGLLDAMAGD